jgi:1,4-dihydroxy-2-naphthoyl-CoA hydrolase
VVKPSKINNHVIIIHQSNIVTLFNIMLWKQPSTLEKLNFFSKNTLNETLSIEFTEIGDDFLRARMPVDARHVQPFRLLHGGASVVLAETLGSVASHLALDPAEKKNPVGLEINANHLRAVTEGNFVIGTVRPLRIGRTVHVWQIEITDGVSGELSCISRITVAITDGKR